MSSELTVSLDRTGIVVEIEATKWRSTTPSYRQPQHILVGATLSPDEARAKASELNDAADAFEANAFDDPDALGDLIRDGA